MAFSVIWNNPAKHQNVFNNEEELLLYFLESENFTDGVSSETRYMLRKFIEAARENVEEVKAKGAMVPIPTWERAED